MVCDRSKVLAHGGNVSAARQRFPGAPEPFLDLSTGISPFPWPYPAPVPHLGLDALTRLPDPADLLALEMAAAQRYGAATAHHVLAAPGTQALLPLIAGLKPPGSFRVLGPTYAEHGRAGRLAGHEVMEVGQLSALAGATIATVVNPNNPDGRLLTTGALRDLAGKVGLLVVDEAFMDVVPAGTSMTGFNTLTNLVVLRSFGKFHGLAGLRLGFAVAPPALLAPLRACLGPWAVSGPAIQLGRAALADGGWADAMLPRLLETAARLNAVLDRHGLQRMDGTALFSLIRGPEALFSHLGGSGILVRRFDERPGLLRIGLPADDAAFARLDAALGGFRPEMARTPSGHPGPSRDMPST